MIDHIDKELEREHSQNTLEDISVTRRNIVVFHTMIKPMMYLSTITYFNIKIEIKMVKQIQKMIHLLPKIETIMVLNMMILLFLEYNPRAD